MQKILVNFIRQYSIFVVVSPAHQLYNRKSRQYPYGYSKMQDYSDVSLHFYFVRIFWVFWKQKRPFTRNFGYSCNPRNSLRSSLIEIYKIYVLYIYKLWNKYYKWEKKLVIGTLNRRISTISMSIMSNKFKLSQLYSIIALQNALCIRLLHLYKILMIE